MSLDSGLWTDIRDDQSGAGALREVFAHFPSGVAAILADVEGSPQVLVASSFQVGISLAPPLVLFSVAHTSTSWPKLRLQPRVGVSVVDEANAKVVRQLAQKSSERFAGVGIESSPSGARYLDGAAVRLECSIYGQFVAGDHDVVLLEVHRWSVLPDTKPIIWYGSAFHRLTPFIDAGE